MLDKIRDKDIIDRIHKAVDYAESHPGALKGMLIHHGIRQSDVGEVYRGTYWENYYIVKTCNLDHRPTRDETDEASFYAVAKILGDGNADLGCKRVLESMKRAL